MQIKEKSKTKHWFIYIVAVITLGTFVTCLPVGAIDISYEFEDTPELIDGVYNLSIFGNTNRGGEIYEFTAVFEIPLQYRYGEITNITINASKINYDNPTSDIQGMITLYISNITKTPNTNGRYDIRGDITIYANLQDEHGSTIVNIEEIYIDMERPQHWADETLEGAAFSYIEKLGAIGEQRTTVYLTKYNITIYEGDNGKYQKAQKFNQNVTRTTTFTDIVYTSNINLSYIKNEKYTNMTTTIKDGIEQSTVYENDVYIRGFRSQITFNTSTTSLTLGIVCADDLTPGRLNNNVFPDIAEDVTTNIPLSKVNSFDFWQNAKNAVNSFMEVELFYNFTIGRIVWLCIVAMLLGAIVYLVRF